MLHNFLAVNHDELVKRCKAKVAKRPVPAPTARELQYGVPILLAQLVDTLRSEQTAELHASPDRVPADIGLTAGKHGKELLQKGFTVDQVVHDYGDLCQAVTELAHEKSATISVDEFHTFNRCLDNAIADAVTEFGRQRDRGISEDRARTMNERLGSLAHELRNLLNGAFLAFHVIKDGNAPVGGATGAVLGRNLLGLRDLVDRSLADVRLTHGLEPQREIVSIRELIDDLKIAAELEAAARDLVLTIAPIDDELAVEADRQMVSSAVSNLLQNAFKFTRDRGHVLLRVSAAADRVLIEVEDECGGLPGGKTEELFQPFEQHGSDRTGLGLGLSISRRGVEANGGTLRVRDLASKGCVFTIDLPRLSHP